jgi:small subunit ribosomal protein S17
MEENIEEGASESITGSSVNPQVTDSITQPNVKVLGDTPDELPAELPAKLDGPAPSEPPKHRRQEKVGLVTSDKMQKTVVVRVERQVQHRKYRRYIRRRTKFMAHDEIGAHTGDIVRIVETRPLSARKRWRVVEIVQKAR